jgi:DNA (cytosine-5)-methyltransferase 1
MPSLCHHGRRPRLLDLYCGGGGASMGYYLAGFDVVGVDNKPQARYPFTFFQADALEFVALYGDHFDAIHASPPCQAYSVLAKRWPDRNYPDLVGPTRDALRVTGRPYVIENVPEAPLIGAVTLCGSMFGLTTGVRALRRHRAFEANWPLQVPSCEHTDGPTISVAGHAGNAGRNNSGSSAERREAMGIPWMATEPLSEAIPPRYTEFIARQLLSSDVLAVAA